MKKLFLMAIAFTFSLSTFSSETMLYHCGLMQKKGAKFILKATHDYVRTLEKDKFGQKVITGSKFTPKKKEIKFKLKVDMSKAPDSKEGELLKNLYQQVLKKSQGETCMHGPVEGNGLTITDMEDM